jgi:hypothetical protein
MRNGLSIFMMRLRQFGIPTGLPLWTSALVIKKRMVPGCGD